MLIHKDVLQLLEDLVDASPTLDSQLSKEISRLKSEATKEKELRSGIKDWLHRIRVSYWLPLEDLARVVFREAFSGPCQEDLTQKVEMSLVGKKGFTVESFLKPLSLGKSSGSQSPDDLALLYRLLECSASRAIEVADLWQAFKNFAMPSPSEATLLLRFGRGLLGLHAMGLFAPQSGGKAHTGYSFDQWRLRKKHFGRIWLKAKDVAITDAMSAIESAVPESVAEVRLAITEFNTSKPKDLPAWAQRWVPEILRSGTGQPATLLKRQLHRGFDPSAKRARGERGSKPRLFMT
jgi:hypothetical protein